MAGSELDPAERVGSVVMQGSSGGGSGRPLPLEARMWVVVIGLGLVIGVCALALPAAAQQIDLLDRIHDGERVSFAEATDNDKRIDGLSRAQLVLFLVTAVAWLVWQSRAYRNELAMGIRDRRFPPRDAILWWLIPIASFVKAKQVMNDIWRGSDPTLRGDEPDFRRRPVDPLVHLWWGILLASTILNRISRSMVDDVETFADAENATKAWMVSDLGMMLAGAFAIMVVMRITRRVEDRRLRHQSGFAQTALAPSAAYAAQGGAAHPTSVGPPGA